MLYCENGGFAVLPDNPSVRSIFQLIVREEDLGRGPNSRAGELIHQFHSPHQPAWLQTQPLRPYNSILVAMHNLSNWALMIWFSPALFLTLSLTSGLSLILMPRGLKFCLDFHTLLSQTSHTKFESFIGVKPVSLHDFYHHKPNTAGWGTLVALMELTVWRFNVWSP